MTRVAAIDCGTNSVRLLVLDAQTGADVHREMRVVRLGEGVDRTGRLSSAALDRTRAALVDYAEVCREQGVTQTRMVATSATRDADNRAEFAALVRSVLGVEPEVVTGTEEASLSFAGATRSLDVGDGPFLVMDVGGGSTEVVLGESSVTGSVSVDVGCVRLTERHLRTDPPTIAEVDAAEADLAEAVERIRDAVPVSQARTAVGLAGSVTTVAAYALGLTTYDEKRLHHTRIDAADVVRACEALLAMSRAERAALPFMHPGRVDVIGGGALVIRALVQGLGLSSVLVSEADILDGIAWSLVG